EPKARLLDDLAGGVGFIRKLLPLVKCGSPLVEIGRGNVERLQTKRPGQLDGGVHVIAKDLARREVRAVTAQSRIVDPLSELDRIGRLELHETAVADRRTEL